MTFSSDISIVIYVVLTLWFQDSRLHVFASAPHLMLNSCRAETGTASTTYFKYGKHHGTVADNLPMQIWSLISGKRDHQWKYQLDSTALLISDNDILKSAVHNAALVFLKHHQRDCLDRLLSITVVKGFWNLQMGYIVSFQQDELDLYEAATGNILNVMFI